MENKNTKAEKEEKVEKVEKVEVDYKALNIYEKLRIVQTELKAPKGQYNAFGKYAYRSCEDILEALKPSLDKVRLVLTISDELTQLADRIYVKAVATLINIDNPGETLSTTAYAREEQEKKGMDGSQVTGASSSYARKYCLNGLFNIDDNKDSDATNTGTTETKKNENTEPLATKEQVEKLKSFKGAEQWVKSKKGCTIEELTSAYAEKLINSFEKNANKQKGNE